MGILATVEPLLDDGALEKYLPMTMDAATYKDHLYQLPLYFETLLFMYNRRYMQDDEVPATTDELLTYMESNTGRGRYGFVEQHSRPPSVCPGGRPCCGAYASCTRNPAGS